MIIEFPKAVQTAIARHVNRDVDSEVLILDDHLCFRFDGHEEFVSSPCRYVFSSDHKVAIEFEDSVLDFMLWL